MPYTYSKMLGRFYQKMRFKQRPGGKMEGEMYQVKGKSMWGVQRTERARVAGAHGAVEGDGATHWKELCRRWWAMFGVLLSKSSGQ